MMFLRTILRNWRLLAAAITAAGIVHLWTTLISVRSGATPGFTQLTADLPVNQISYLPEITPESQKLPFMMPDVRYAVCHYDASDGPIRVRAEVPGPGWSLSLHAPAGDNFLYVPGTEDRATTVNILLKAPSKRFETETLGTVAVAQGSPEIKLNSPVGVAIYKAPIDALAFRRQIDERLNSFKCFQERRRS